MTSSPTRARGLLAVLMVGTCVVLSACSGVGNRGNTTGFVSGDGSEAITTVDAADREKAPVLEGEGLDGRPLDRKSTRLNSSHCTPSRMPSSA